ncbi:hypothetical protein Tco_0607997 [Tanacetum coccineum]
MCMFALTVSIVEPKNIKEAMADSAWIEAMQDELHQFDRLKVWELVDKPFGKMIIKLKWLWKNKKDEDQTYHPEKVYLLRKALYGLKQAPRAGEYVALSASFAPSMWMRTQLQDYGFNYNKILLYRRLLNSHEQSHATRTTFITRTSTSNNYGIISYKEQAENGKN